MSTRETWLNGWSRDSAEVLLGTGVHCAGCGMFLGLACVSFEAGWTPPKEYPTWPFDEETCPVHNRPPPALDDRDKLTERMERLARLNPKRTTHEDQNPPALQRQVGRRGQALA